jgi:hypothetical protein
MQTFESLCRLEIVFRSAASPEVSVRAAGVAGTILTLACRFVGGIRILFAEAESARNVWLAPARATCACMRPRLGLDAPRGALETVVPVLARFRVPCPVA